MCLRNETKLNDHSVLRMPLHSSAVYFDTEKNHNRFETKKSVGNNGGQKKARHGKRRYDGPFFQVKTSRSQDPRCRIHRFRW